MGGSLTNPNRFFDAWMRSRLKIGVWSPVEAAKSDTLDHQRETQMRVRHQHRHQYSDSFVSFIFLFIYHI